MLIKYVHILLGFHWAPRLAPEPPEPTEPAESELIVKMKIENNYSIGLGLYVYYAHSISVLE